MPADAWHRNARLVTPQPGSGGTVNVGVIFDRKMTDAAVRFLVRANERLKTEGIARNFIYAIESNPSAGCGTQLEEGDGAFAAIELHYHKNVSAFFGPACGKDISLISRMISAWDALEFNCYRIQDFHIDDNIELSVVQISTMSAVNMAMNIVAVLTALSWQKIALITCSACFNESLGENAMGSRLDVISKVLIENGINVLDRVDIAESWLTPYQIAARIHPVKTKARIIVAIFGDTLAAYEPYLTAMELAELNTDEFMSVLALNTYASKIVGNNGAAVAGASVSTTQHLIVPPWRRDNGGIDERLLKYFKRAIVVLNDYYNATALSNFIKDMGLTGISMTDQITYVQLYESYWLYVYCLESAFQLTLNPEIRKNNTYIRSLMLTHRIQGPFGEIIMNGLTQRLAPYRVFKVETERAEFDEIVLVEPTVNDGECAPDKIGSAQHGCASLTAKMNEAYENYFDALPHDTPACGFVGELCDQRGTIIVVVMIMLTICAGFVIFLCFRRVKTGETSQMPWAIPAHSISFVDLEFTGSSNMSIHSIQQQMEGKSEMKDLLRNRQLATIEQGFVIVEPFKLKEKLNFDKRDMQLLFQMKQAVHDNINPFIGVCIDKTHELYLIWRHCFRGTLADLLFASKDPNRHDDSRPAAVDNNFKGAFVRDIIKGIDFLHSSSIGYHGALTSSQCLVDSHWILKISGFGISRLLFKWRHNGVLNAHPCMPLIPNSELHYYAPETRRAIRHAVQRNRPEDLQFSNEDGQAQDMYSFGAILYEILYRRKIIDLDDEVEVNDGIMEEEIGIGIFNQAAEQKLPLYPTFPDDEIHPDLLSLMHKCFNGKVDQRPDANMVRKITDATLKMPGSLVDQMIKNMEQYTNNLENLVREQTGKLEEEQQHAEQILLELLPKSVIDELRLGRRVEPKFYKSVTIMYSDIVGFTSLCSESQPIEVVALLNGMFKAFDHAISQHKAYKVETIGDAYMVASGVPEKMRTDHVREIACIALMQREFLNCYEIPHRPGQYLHCRWGFNSGSVFTGVVGVTAPRYCVFGATVTLAAKMENSGQPDKIQMTLKSYQLLSEQFPEFNCSPRGGVRLEGVGTLLTYWLESHDELITITDGSATVGGRQMLAMSTDGTEAPSPLMPTASANASISPALIPPPSPPDLTMHHVPLSVRHSISPSLNSIDERAISNLSAFQNGRL